MKKTKKRKAKTLSQKISQAIVWISICCTVIADVVATISSDMVHTSGITGGQPKTAAAQAAKAVQTAASAPLQQNNFLLDLIIVGVNAVFLVIFLFIALQISKRIARTITKPIQNMTTAANAIAEGDLSAEITVQSDDETGLLAHSLNRIRQSLISLSDESENLKEAGLNGDLSTRGETGRLPGCYAGIIDGFNKTLDAVAAPLDESGVVLGKMAVNDYTAAMRGEYKGRMKEFADSINHVHTRLLSVQDVFQRVSVGDTGLLDQFKTVGSRSENDRLIPAMIATMQSIQDLMDQAGALAAAAAVGDLDVRGDAGKLEGGYRRIIEGMNKTMEAFSAPVEEISSVLGKLARGNLAVEMTGEYDGKYNQIKEAMNQAIEKFNELLAEINIAADQVAAGSKQVSGASQALSQGATEQASSIEELTSSIAQIADQTRQNATGAEQASKLSTAVKADAVNSNKKMTQMLSSMNEINEASVNISKIIKVIDDIAFQTNILALNAAVEAARAGQYGKGFAVVAEEVRNLAGKSASAAKDTTSLIENSIAKVKAGMKIAGETAGTLREIVESAEKSALLVSNIAAASNGQATAIAQIDQGVTQVSSVVQTNSATAEESAASSEELSGQAETLAQMVGQFQLKGSAGQKVKMPGGPRRAAKRTSAGAPSTAGSFDPAKSVITLEQFGKY